MSSRSLNWLKFGGLVGAAFALGLLVAGLLDLPRSGNAQEATVRPAIATVAPPKLPPSVQSLQNLSDAFAAVVEAVRPAVVYVKAQKTEKVAERRRMQVPPGFERMFPQGRQQPEIQRGSGSGFIVSADGYILTNNHVVADADQVTVRLLDRREFKARVVGADPNTDVAVLKIEATNLSPVSLGNSDGTRIGDWVLAIGNPLGEGLTFTVTSGIISAKGRRLDGLQNSTYNISDFIQTDAAINPGNSGGPLLNVRGEVVGMNSAIASETGFYSGYGFAVPINLARLVMNQLITDGKVHRAAIGVAIQEASPKDAKYVGLTEVRGVVVSQLTEGSPAAEAGIELGDVITAVEGVRIDRVSQLQQLIGFRKPGEMVSVEVARKGGVKKTYRVRLQALPDATEIATAEKAEGEDEGDETAPTRKNAPSSMEKLGITVQTLTAETAEEIGFPAGAKGVLVMGVDEAGPAYGELWNPSMNLPPALITEIEGKPVKTEADLRAAVKGANDGDVLTLKVLRLTGPKQATRQIVRLQIGATQ
ncbi:MAG: Do family serine endopeptidase [Myxococcaceae bacterium]|nr:Do family serine endopeptidase [Myxococcaceae bacterium]